MTACVHTLHSQATKSVVCFRARHYKMIAAYCNQSKIALALTCTMKLLTSTLHTIGNYKSTWIPNSTCKAQSAGKRSWRKSLLVSTLYLIGLNKKRREFLDDSKYTTAKQSNFGSLSYILWTLNGKTVL